MSYTTEIKQEVAFNKLKDCCARAELSALIKLTSSLSISNRQLQLIVRSENPTTAKRVITLVKQLYPIQTKLEIIQKTNLKKNNVYTVNIVHDARIILEDLGLYSSKGLLNHPSYQIVLKDCDARAYIAGCFLAYGSCNSPSNTNYHLEISVSEEEHARFILKLTDRFIKGAKISKRRNKYIIYIKRAELISDFLRLIGASDSVMKFEDARINRDLRTGLVRTENCIIANIAKTISAAEKQIEAIDVIKKANKFEMLPEKIKNAAIIRYENPETSLQELCCLYQKRYGDVISKSGYKHRLNKIEEIAEKLSQ